MLATRVLLIRHGQTEWNLQGRFQGQLDSNLSSVGKAQANALRHTFSAAPLAQLYSSDLGRAFDTAQLLQGDVATDVQTDSRLRERAMGVFQGNTRADIETQFPEAWKQYKSLDPDYRIEGGGESIHDVQKRAFGCLEELAARHVGETIGCVTHGGFIRIVLKAVLGIPFQNPTRFRVLNTSVHHLISESPGWAIETLGAIHHLPERP